MSVLIITDKTESFVGLADSIQSTFGLPVYSYQKNLSGRELQEIQPEIIIILSEKNETWAWYMTGELIHIYPEANFVLVQLTDELDYFRVILKKIYLVTAARERLEQKIGALLVDILPV
jgi:hypothetical protein